MSGAAPAAPARWPYRDHRTIADLDRIAATPCTGCRQHRASACGYSRCPLPKAIGGAA